jgi:hypothetical protein
MSVRRLIALVGVLLIVGFALSLILATTGNGHGPDTVRGKRVPPPRSVR